MAFKLFGFDVPPEIIACCNESTGVCRDIVSPETCLPEEVAHPGATCAFVDCEVVLGACCDDMAGSCFDGVTPGDCVGMRFEANETCAMLMPPCGSVDPGACCLDDQSCQDLTPTDCSQLGGSWNAGNCATFECPPATNNCSMDPVFIGDGTHPFTTVGATTDGPAGGPCADVENDVWFRYLASCDGLLTLSLCSGTDFNSAIEVYQTLQCPTTFAALVECDNDGCGDMLGTSTISLAVMPGEFYLIRVGGVGGATGTGQLVVGCVPTDQGACCLPNGQCSLTLAGDCAGDFFLGEPCSPITCPTVSNDTCDDAIAVGEGMHAVDTTTAMTDGPMDSPGGICTEVNQDIWLQYTASCNGTLDVSLCGTADYDAALAVYDGCACPPAGGPIACDNDGCGPSGAAEIRRLPVAAGNCYLIRVGGAGAATGTGTLSISCTPGLPPGECCAGDVSSDTLLDESDVPIMVQMLLNPPSEMDPVFCSADVNGDLLVNGRDIPEFVDRLVSAAICTVSALTGGCCFPDGACLEMTQQDCFNDAGQYQGNETTCSPNNCPQPPMPPVNDVCGGAILIDCNSQTVLNNELATSEAGDPSFSCAFGGAAQGDGTVWYTFVAGGEDALISTCNTIGDVTDTLIAVYDLSGCPVGAELACSEDAGGTCQRLSEVCVTGLTIGETYTIQVASFPGETQGEITLDLACPCPQGACCFANGLCEQLRSDQCFAAGGDFQGDGVPCDPNPCSEPAPVTCCEGDINVDGLIDLGDVPELVAALLSTPLLGTPEFCRADLSGDGAVDGRDITAFVPMALSPTACATPSNDDCASAMMLMCDERVIAENTYATTVPADPVMDCKAGGPGQAEGTLWFSFTATDTSAFITTCDLFLPPIDTIIAVYDAPCPTAGDQIPGACNEDIGGVCSRFSELCVSGLTMGNTYYVLVGSSDPADLGFISVDVTCPCP